MAWDWDGRYIDADKDDRRDWVPMTPQTLQIRGADHGEKTKGAGGDFEKEPS